MKTNWRLREDIEINHIGDIINLKPNIETPHTSLKPNIETPHTSLKPNMKIIRNTKIETQTQNPKPKVEIIRKP